MDEARVVRRKAFAERRAGRRMEACGRAAWVVGVGSAAVRWVGLRQDESGGWNGTLKNMGWVDFQLSKMGLI